MTCLKKNKRLVYSKRDHLMSDQWKCNNEKNQCNEDKGGAIAIQEKWSEPEEHVSA